jgi:hypothetical protein
MFPAPALWFHLGGSLCSHFLPLLYGQVSSLALKPMAGKLLKGSVHFRLLLDLEDVILKNLGRMHEST